MALMVGVAAGAVYLRLPRGPSEKAVVAQAAKHDPQFAMVDRYLKETLDDGAYDVVRWWPAVSRKPVEDLNIAQNEAGVRKGEALIRENQRAIDALKGKGIKEPAGDRFTPPPLSASDDQKNWATLRNRIADLRDQIAGLEQDIAIRRACSSDSVCRLRYRTINRLNAKTLVDTIFVLRGEEVIPIPDDDDRYLLLRADLETLFGATPTNQPVDPAAVFDAVIEEHRRRD